MRVGRPQFLIAAAAITGSRSADRRADDPSEVRGVGVADAGPTVKIRWLTRRGPMSAKRQDYDRSSSRTDRRHHHAANHARAGSHDCAHRSSTSPLLAPCQCGLCAASHYGSGAPARLAPVRLGWRRNDLLRSASSIIATPFSMPDADRYCASFEIRSRSRATHQRRRRVERSPPDGESPRVLDGHTHHRPRGINDSDESRPCGGARSLASRRSIRRFNRSEAKPS